MLNRQNVRIGIWYTMHYSYYYIICICRIVDTSIDREDTYILPFIVYFVQYLIHVYAQSSVIFMLIHTWLFIGNCALLINFTEFIMHNFIYRVIRNKLGFLKCLLHFYVSTQVKNQTESFNGKKIIFEIMFQNFRIELLRPDYICTYQKKPQKP